ncbi:MAG TPA: FAD-dependent oxidoreductase [Ideonella sp.]|nr:FAD-dependent oxidoreductase [Ideonella sp.]
MTDYQALEFEYRRSPEQAAAEPALHPVVVVGAGPIGLALAIDLAQRGQRVLLLDNDCRLSTGSRAICFAKRTLEIFDRLGCGQRMVDKGVSWSVGKVFLRDQPVYRFDLLPESGHERPAFINLQQYYVEGFLAERAAELPNLEIRWKNKVVAVEPRGDRVVLGIDTPDGRYALHASWVAACDGSRSAVRALLGLEATGRVFHDRFLIADVKIDVPLFSDAPSERWFWFDPPFHRGQSVLLHRQPDNVWRMDFQLGWDADPEVEKRPENILPRVRALLAAVMASKGEQGLPEFTLEWASVYTFACLRMARFRHGRVLFAGDSAHGVSPFGARGANSGVQDADNLAWKLDAVLKGAVQGRAAETLLDSYASEREHAADENILNSTRSTDFITPKSEASRLFRDAVLDLARDHPFARRIVNSGRLSVPATLDGSPLSTPDADAGWAGAMRPGAPAADAPLAGARWLLRELGRDFTLLVRGGVPAWAAELPAQVKTLALDASHDAQGLLAQRYDLRPGSAYLLRPDQHVAALWRAPTLAAVQAALQRAQGMTE